ncbi:MAG: MMPL family transporter [Dehalococcoidia bacterium]|nr:MMPL family transporter [Dehalococcoidia bacterium]
MSRFLSPAALARASANHPWLTLGAWVLIIAAAIVSSGQLKVNETQEIRGAESTRATDLLEDRIRGEAPASETIVVQSYGRTVDDPAFRLFVEGLTADVRELGGTVTFVTSYYESQDASLVSADGTKTILPVTLAGSREDAPDTVEPLLAVLEAHRSAEFSVLTAGDGSINKEITEQFEKDLAMGEMIGIPAAIVVLVIVFGAAAAAGVPIVLSLLGILVSVGITAAASQFMGINSVAINIITMIGLAVGIDYTLFIVERFREERDHGLAKVDAIVKAGDTASRAVLFSGITVIIALAGMLIVPATVFQSLAFGAIMVVVAAVALALTLLPAGLSLAGDRINWLTIPGRRRKAQVTEADPNGGFFGKTTQLVMRHPVVSAAGASALLVALALPYAAIEIGSPGLTEYPASMESVQAFTVLDTEFSAGRLDPTEVVIEGDMDSPEVRAAVDRLGAAIAQDAGFAGISALQPAASGDIGYVSIIINGDSTGPEAMDAVRRLRSDYIPAAFAGAEAEVSVGGGTALTLDYIETMKTYLPIVIGFVLTLSFLLLMLVFRSIVIPVKAIVMNLLSVGAAYGLIVLVFQEGVGAELLGFQQTDSITAFLPVFLFAILFGLSMDYHVFLLSRIQERFVHTGDNTHAVAYGLRSTAHIITGAAAIMMVVFAGFAAGDMVDLQQMGFGLAVAVFLDATIVRSVLVPASMELLGARNWYFPSWLEWLPKISVEGPAAQEPQVHGPVLAPFEYAQGAAD